MIDLIDKHKSIVIIKLDETYNAPKRITNTSDYILQTLRDIENVTGAELNDPNNPYTVIVTIEADTRYKISKTGLYLRQKPFVKNSLTIHNQEKTR